MREEKKTVTRVLVAIAAASALFLALTAFAPSNSHSIGAPEPAAAQVTKSRGSGSGGSADATRLGDRAAQLGSGWAIPLTIFIAGVLLTAALVTRNIGAAVGVILVAILALIFFASPDSIRRFAEGVGQAIF
jgi:hypothetical protein